MGAGLVGCAGSGHPLSRPAELSVQRIRIQPFTKPASFDDDERPDGLSVWVQAQDAFDDPVKATGDLVFELYSFRPASSNPKGEQLVSWHHAIRSRADQRTFWDRPSQMYHFELAWSPPPAAAETYVLAVTLTTPHGDHLFDEMKIQVNVEALRDQFAGP